MDLRRSLALRELAVHRYEGALATASEAPQALAWIRAESLFQLGRYEEALPLLDPTDPFQALLHLEALERLGRTDEARADLPQVAELIGAEDPRLLGVLGRLDAGDGAHAAAARSFEAVLAHDPYDLGALFGLGQAKLRSGAREEGLELLERHRELVPLMDQWDFAQRAVDLAPLHAANHAQLGDVERALGRLDRAREAYLRAASLSDDRALAPVVLRLARLLEEDLADPDAAVTALDAGAAQSGDLRLIVRAGDVLMRVGRADEAAARFQAALARRPGDPALEARLAQAMASTGATSTGDASPDDGDGR